MKRIFPIVIRFITKHPKVKKVEKGKVGANLFFGKRNSFKFEHFQVADIFGINYKPNCRANTVDSPVSGSTGINVQKLEFLIIDDFQDMRMTSYKKFWRLGFKNFPDAWIVLSGIASDVGH